MKLSTTSEYALKALIELAINYDRGIPVILINEVAERKKIPPKYLEHILLSLKKAGILGARRGVGGGYSLNRPPETISLGEIIRVVEGPLVPVKCLSTDECVTCQDESLCGLYSVMLDVRNAVSNILDNTTLKEVANRTQELINRHSKVLNYVI